MSPAEFALLARIRRRSDLLGPDVRRRLLAAYELIRASMTEAEILRALQSGTLDRLLTELVAETVEPSLADLRQMVDLRTLEAGREWTRLLPGSLRGTFGVLNPLVIDAVRSLDRTVTTRIAEEVRETVRDAAEAGLRAGQNPRAVAKTIKDVIGLAPNQAKAVANFRAQLLSGDRAALSRVLGRGVIRTPDGSLVHRAAHAGGQGLGKRDLAMLDRVLGTKPLRADQVERMVEAYRKRMLALNAEAHARSIALDANRLAQRLSWEDAIARGIIGRNRVRRTWLATAGPAGDGRNRPEHLALHGVTVGMDTPYPNGELVPGEHSWGCRCGERFTVVAAVQLLAA